MIIYKYDSGWYPVRRCVACKEELSDSELMHSKGICPYCGNDSKSTVCNYYNEVRRIYKIIQLRPRFPFIFKHEHTEVKR